MLELPFRGKPRGIKPLAPLVTFPLTIWRGSIAKNKRGHSWTTDKGKAIWFASRLKQPNEKVVVQELKVTKDQIFAFLAGRGESEIVLRTQTVKTYKALKT